jgi:uncharacterized lipoprotein YbaY
MQDLTRALAAVAVVATFTACAPAPPSQPQAAVEPEAVAETSTEAVDLAGTEWVAATVDGDPVAANVSPTMSFDADGRVTGSAGCNRYFGAYAIDGGSITFGHLAATQMMCPPEQMQLEQRYLATLAGVATFERGVGRLVLYSSDGGETMVLNEVEPSPLVTGSVLYRERIALPPNATLQVQLVDVSRMDAPAVVLGEQIVSPTGQVPIPFEIAYDPGQIDDRMSYAIQARIEVDGELMFISTRAYPVITRDSPTKDLEILVERAGPASE